MYYHRDLVVFICIQLSNSSTTLLQSTYTPPLFPFHKIIIFFWIEMKCGNFLYSIPQKHHCCKVLFQFFKQFQRRSSKCEKLTTSTNGQRDIGHLVIAKAHKPFDKWTKKEPLYKEQQSKCIFYVYKCTQLLSYRDVKQ